MLANILVIEPLYAFTFDIKKINSQVLKFQLDILNFLSLNSGGANTLSTDPA